ncbi:hypothetical protein [uncultured Faecalibacterium sp.]|uniref:hypothetical protein n=1 Tax=uncultured Faecalibacterium sp. TaxID=259315 RepID=UPI002804BE96|nr:hypothetical protein [uncultured Faecalibacterium sp.]
MRQFYFPGWCGAQKTSACISGTSHKNVRYVPDRPVTIIKVRRYGALFLIDNSLQNRKNDAFFPLHSIPENIFQKMYRFFSWFLAFMQHSVMFRGVFLHTFIIFVCWLQRHEKL